VRAPALAATALAAALAAAGPARAQDGAPAPAKELAHIMLDDAMRKTVSEQVASHMLQAIGTTLQERLNRRLYDDEWASVSAIVKRFVSDTFPPSRTEEITATVYARHFNEAELRELVRFQRSDVGRRSAQLAPVIAVETAQAIDAEIKRSPAVPRLLDELQREFPVLKVPQSP
jgi:hypothetical protein